MKEIMEEIMIIIYVLTDYEVFDQWLLRWFPQVVESALFNGVKLLAGHCLDEYLEQQYSLQKY